jgi:hypothetical protein
MSGSPITEAGLSASAGAITQSPISDCAPARGPKKSDARPTVTRTRPASCAAIRSRAIRARTRPLRVWASAPRSSVNGRPLARPYM